MWFRKSKEQPLERLEREANDDFHLLAELGPSYFGAEHLVELHERLRWRMARFDRLQRLNMLIGLTAIGWLALGLGAMLAGWITVAQIAFCIMGVVLAGFIAGAWLLKWKYESRGELEYTLRTIEEELRRRAALHGRSAPL
ncbi:MAG: hypothetical protein EP344_06695 [Bacteroidetes bacterium]|nr:MAG: hypothetical protein EP344_06695 [Bacteroidota bacterium]